MTFSCLWIWDYISSISAFTSDITFLAGAKQVSKFRGNIRDKSPKPSDFQPAEIFISREVALLG